MEKTIEITYSELLRFISLLEENIPRLRERNIDNLADTDQRLLDRLQELDDNY